jgi:DNA polymerase III delta prime subunit
MGFDWMHNWYGNTFNNNLIGGLLKFENYLKFGKELIIGSFEEENFIKKSKDNLIGFGIENDTRTLHMFTDTYELIAASNKALLHIDGQFYSDTPPFEYVFKIDDQFYGIFYTLVDGVDYRYKASIVKKDMTQKEGLQILRRLVKDYINHRKQIQEDLFKKGEKVLDDVILPKKLKESVLDDIKNFLKSRKKYKEFGMVWKRGYIFHGPPGNGKTLFLRKLGLALGLNMTDMTNRIDTDGTLRLPQQEVPYENGSSNLSLSKLASGDDDENPPEIYYLEDMEKVIGKNNDDFGRISLSNFLTAIDGVSRLADGLIIIGTTNYKDRLENAIIGRPGRFDRVYEFAKPTNKEIYKFFERRNFLIQDKKVTINYSKLMMEKNFSMAFVEDFILSCVTKVNKHIISTSIADSVIKDLGQYNQLEAKSNLGFGK